MKTTLLLSLVSITFALPIIPPGRIDVSGNFSSKDWNGTYAQASRAHPKETKKLVDEFIALVNKTDTLIFNTSIRDFEAARQRAIQKGPSKESKLNWESDNCTKSPDSPFGYDFSAPCRRHDFGYRNMNLQGRLSVENCHRIDDVFGKEYV